jgi:hypothetical protein
MPEQVKRPNPWWKKMMKTALQESEDRNIYCNTSQFGVNYCVKIFIAAIFRISDLPPVYRRNKDGGQNLRFLQTAPVGVRKVLTVSAM